MFAMWAFNLSHGRLLHVGTHCHPDGRPDVHDEPTGHISMNPPAQHINGDEKITTRDENLDKLFDMVQEMVKDRDKEKRERDEKLDGLSEMLERIMRRHDKQEELDEQRLARLDEEKFERNAKMEQLFDMVAQLNTDREEEGRRNEEEREVSRAGLNDNLDTTRRLFDEQAERVNGLVDTLRQENAKQMDTLMMQMKSSTTSSGVPFNVMGYLDEFSKALSGEIRMLLVEVGSLHEKKRSLQFEMGELLMMRSRYGPGGDFDPDWMPPRIGPPGGQPTPPPPPPPPPPKIPQPTKPIWTNVLGPLRRKKHTSQPQPFPTPTVDSPQTEKPIWTLPTSRNGGSTRRKKQHTPQPQPFPTPTADSPQTEKPTRRLPTLGNGLPPANAERRPPPLPDAALWASEPPVSAKPAWRTVLQRSRSKKKAKKEKPTITVSWDSSPPGTLDGTPEEIIWDEWKPDDNINVTPPPADYRELEPPPPPPPREGLFGSFTTHSSQYPRLRQG